MKSNEMEQNEQRGNEKKEENNAVRSEMLVRLQE